MAIDRDKVMRALDIAEALPCDSRITIIFDRDEPKTRITLLAHAAIGADADAVVKKALEFCPRFKRERFVRDEIWASAEVDGIEINLAHIGECKVTYKEIEEPEMAPTGKMVKKKVPVFDCEEEDIVAEKSEAAAPVRDAGQGGDTRAP